MCIRQRRISHCSSEKEEGRLSFLVLYVTLKPRYFFGALIQTKPIELIFPLISLWLLHKVFKRVVISAGGRLAGSLVWRLVPSAADMPKTRQLPLKKRVMSALWRETVFLPLTDLRFLPTLGTARSWQPLRQEAISCSIAKRRALCYYVLQQLAAAWEQPRFCATGTNREKSDFPLLASWKQ